MSGHVTTAFVSVSFPMKYLVYKQLHGAICAYETIKNLPGLRMD